MPGFNEYLRDILVSVITAPIELVLAGANITEEEIMPDTVYCPSWRGEKTTVTIDDGKRKAVVIACLNKSWHGDLVYWRNCIPIASIKDNSVIFLIDLEELFHSLPTEQLGLFNELVISVLNKYNEIRNAPKKADVNTVLEWIDKYISYYPSKLRSDIGALERQIQRDVQELSEEYRNYLLVDGVCKSLFQPQPIQAWREDQLDALRESGFEIIQLTPGNKGIKELVAVSPSICIEEDYTKYVLGRYLVDFEQHRDNELIIMPLTKTPERRYFHPHITPEGVLTDIVRACIAVEYLRAYNVGTALLKIRYILETYNPDQALMSIQKICGETSCEDNPTKEKCMICEKVGICKASIELVKACTTAIDKGECQNCNIYEKCKIGRRNNDERQE